MTAAPPAPTPAVVAAAGAAAAETPWGVHGQQAAVAALRSAMARDRLAHAYLFTGPASVGKATLARRLAQTLACEAAEELRPCLACRSCTKVEANEAPDVERIAIGGVCDEQGHRDHVADGSRRIRICQVRRLGRVASLAPFSAPRRIFILDSADNLQPEAAHALLKTLEEPPPAVLLLLITTDPASLLPTIRSRCQEVALRPMARPDIAQALVASAVPAEEAERLASIAGGRFGRAMREHLDPSLRLLRETAIEDLRRLCRTGRNERFDYAATFARRWSRERQSVLETIDVWRAWWREVLRSSAAPTVHAPEDAPLAGEPSDGGWEAQAAADARECSPASALRALRATQRAREHLLVNTNPQLAVEVLMLDLPTLDAPPITDEPDLPQSDEPHGEEAREAAVR